MFWKTLYEQLAARVYRLHYLALALPTNHWIKDWKQIFRIK
jgi:hypothetical protein